MRAVHVKTPALMCNGCTSAVEQTLTAIDGVISATADFNSGTTSVMYDERQVDTKTLIAAIIEAGFEVEYPR